MKRKPSKLKRVTHIPAFSPERLADALLNIDGAALSKHTRTTLANMLKAAAQRGSETPEAVIRTLPVERRMNVQQVQQAVGAQTQAVTQRGSAGLLGMSEDEWQKVLDESD